MRSRISLAIAACLAIPGSAAAHDTWLLARLEGAPRSALHVEMTSGVAFPALESGISADRVNRAMWRAGSQAAPLPAPLPTKAALRYLMPKAPLGVVAIWVELLPRALDLEPKLIDEYLREIGMSSSVLPRWRARPDPKKWHEVYRKHAKTFVRAGDVLAEDAAWREPVGMELELVPDSDPTGLESGSSFSLIVLKRGRPLAGLPVAAERGEKQLRQRTFETSDAQGRVRFVLDRSGPWLFAATELRENGADWESDFTTLTVSVRQPLRAH